MIRIYIKQAWELLRQNPLFSTLYIVGTGLAIAMTMIMAVVLYVKAAPVYPEVNRMQTYYMKSARFELDVDGHKHNIQWAFGYQAVQEWFYPLKNAEVVSASLSDDMAYNSYVQPADLSGDFPVRVKLIDPAFFRIYAFHFLEGKAFTEADLNSGIRTAVITEEMSRRLFGTSVNVVGRTFTLNYSVYRVCGVVRGASYLTSKSYSQIYVPYSVVSGYREGKMNLPYLGAFSLTMIVKDEAQAEALRAEIKEIVRKMNQIHKDEWKLEIWDQPTSHQVSAFRQSNFEEFDMWGTVRFFLLLLLVLLLIPALNLSGMIASRMESRLAEMGVRKSFGAGRSSLLSQVMWENLLLTLLGGALGILLAWLALYVCREWVFTVFDDWFTAPPQGVEVRVSGEMLFAPVIFLFALLLCLVLNLLSALIPAWSSLRNPIVHSLNEKR